MKVKLTYTDYLGDEKDVVLSNLNSDLRDLEAIERELSRRIKEIRSEKRRCCKIIHTQFSGSTTK